MGTLNTDTADILNRYLSLPAPEYAELYEAQEERDEALAEVSDLKDSVADLKADMRDKDMEIDSGNARIAELEAALADALSWVAEPLGGIDTAQANREFSRLWGIL